MSSVSSEVMARFRERLGEALKDVKAVDIERLPFLEEYKKRWIGFGEKREPAGPVVVCDGSSQEKIKFRGAPEIYAALAMAYAFYPREKRHSPPTFDWDVVVQRMVRPTTEMRVLELRVFREALEKTIQEGKEVLGLYDGHLYLTPETDWLKERSEKKAGLAQRYVEELTALHDLAKNEGVTIAGRSKDSMVNYYYMYVFTGSLAVMMENPAIKREREHRRILQMMAREESAQEMIEMMEPALGLTDEELFGLVKGSVGYAEPLLLASPVLYSPYEGELGSSWWDSSYREQMSNWNRRLTETLDEYYSRPPVALTYWSPMERLGAFRVDVLSKEGASGDMAEHELAKSDWVESAIARMNSLFRESVLDIGLLTEIDQIVHLGRSEFEAYKSIAEAKLREMGFKAGLRRRDVREKVVRGR